MSKVLVFRERLFVPSETFIPSQVQAMQRYKAIYVSRRLMTNVPENVRAISLDSNTRIFGKTGFVLGGRSRVLENFIIQENVRLLHAHFGPDGMLILPTAKHLGLPSIITMHGRDVTVSKRSLLRTRRPVAARYAMTRVNMGRKATRILCVSNYLAHKAVEIGIPEEKIATHYIGVNTQQFPISDTIREPVFLHVARLVEKKGTANLIQAFRMIAHKHADARVDIVGDGPLRAGLESMVNSCELAGRVRFLGQQNPTQVRAHLNRAAAFVLPSVRARNGDQEGLPISILEAMSTGTPVISTRHSGIPEAIPNDEFGLLVEENDILGLAERMDATLSAPSWASRIGLAGANRVRKDFDLFRQSQKLELIYDELLGQNK